jgi:hypothetical protein
MPMEWLPRTAFPGVGDPKIEGSATPEKTGPWQTHFLIVILTGEQLATVKLLEVTLSCVYMLCSLPHDVPCMS